MFGVTDVYCIRYGALDIDHLTGTGVVIIMYIFIYGYQYLQYLEKTMNGYRLQSPPGCPSHIMI